VHAVIAITLKTPNYLAFIGQETIILGIIFTLQMLNSDSTDVTTTAARKPPFNCRK
jgi:hypothetical protein